MHFFPPLTVILYLYNLFRESASVRCEYPLSCCTLTDVDWQVVVHYVLFFFSLSLRDDIIALVVVTLHYGASQGDCVLKEQTRKRLNLRHLLPFPPASEGGLCW